MWWWSLPQSTGTQLWKYWDDSYNNGAGGWQTVSGETTPPQSTIASSIVSTTLSYTGQFTRGPLRPVTLNSTEFDCSAWVYFVLLNINPTLANQIGSNTTSIQSYITSNGGYHNNPQVGDLVVWGGHVEFVVSVSGNAIEISGSNGPNGGAVPKVSGTGGWLTVGGQQLNSFGAGGFLGFFTIRIIQEL